MLNAQREQRGFSLIELLVGMVVLAILVSAAVPSFSAWIKNTQLRTAAETISGGLQLARAEAVKRNTSVQFTLSGTTNVDAGWAIGCVNPVTADLNGDGLPDCPADIQSRPAKEGTGNVRVTADAASIVFTGLGRSTNAGSVAIHVSNPIGGACRNASGPMRCLDIIVNAGGQTRMCDPSLPNTNPQGC